MVRGKLQAAERLCEVKESANRHCQGVKGANEEEGTNDDCATRLCRTVANHRDPVMPTKTVTVVE